MALELLHHPAKTQTDRNPILFVHGAWHGAWCWEPYFMPYFAEHGFETYAVSLRGHGKSDGNPLWARVGGYIDDVAWAVDKIKVDTGKHPVIVGHSMGGYVLQKYLETYDAPAAVLLASVPVSGTMAFFWRYFRKYPLRTLKAGLTFDTYSLIADPEITKSLVSVNLSDEEYMRYHAKLCAESYVVVFQSALFALPSPIQVRTPIMVIGAEEDVLFTVPEQEKTARYYRTEAVIMPDIGHDMMLDAKWQDTADQIIAWLKSSPRVETQGDNSVTRFTGSS